MKKTSWRKHITTGDTFKPLHHVQSPSSRTRIIFCSVPTFFRSSFLSPESTSTTSLTLIKPQSLEAMYLLQETKRIRTTLVLFQTDRQISRHKLNWDRAKIIRKEDLHKSPCTAELLPRQQALLLPSSRS